MSRMAKSLLTVLFCFSFAAVAMAGEGTRLVVDQMGEGDVAPDFTLENFQTGKAVTLSDYIGKKIIMLEFWATWCDICKEELPELVKEYKDLKDKGFEILAITLSPGDKGDRKKIADLRDKHGIEYPILLDTKYQVATELYQLKGPIPLKLIIDCKGKLRYEHVGDFSEGSEVPFVVEALLEEGNCSE
ncbi:MAG: hypothetical protein C0608_05370 [Deltaproteobacteria bacterium]|nr:MAG: hypothetical protein C0608_05370 [Deltaproteobacteria bacterium]